MVQGGQSPRWPDTLCLLSAQPLFGLLEPLLDFLQVRWLLQPDSLPQILSHLLHTPIPIPGGLFKFTLPRTIKIKSNKTLYNNNNNNHNSSSPRQQSVSPARRGIGEVTVTLQRLGGEGGVMSGPNACALSDTLSPDNLLLLFSALCCEQRLVFVSDSLTTLSSCIHGTAALLHPFQWPHILVWYFTLIYTCLLSFYLLFTHYH